MCFAGIHGADHEIPTVASFDRHEHDQHTNVSSQAIQSHLFKVDQSSWYSSGIEVLFDMIEKSLLETNMNSVSRVTAALFHHCCFFY